jgi:hypothetical protein
MRLRHVAGVLSVQVALGLAAFHCSGPEAPRLGGPNALEGKDHPRPSSSEEVGGGLCGGGKGAIDGGPCAVSFKTDIVPLLTGASWACATSSCHAGTAAPKMTPGDDKQIWDSLRRESTGGKPYINPCSIDPGASSFECNLQAMGACGTKMPFAPGTQPTEAELKKVRDWLTCGSPFN